MTPTHASTSGSHSLHATRSVVGSMLALLLAACTAGQFQPVTEPAASATDSDSMGVASSVSDHLPMASACSSQAPAPRALRRLTVTELNNTVADLFNDVNAPKATSLFAGDALAYGFDNVQTQLAVRDNQAMALSNYAEAVGTYAAGIAPTLSSCQTMDAECRTLFLTTFGRKAFRAPLTEAQIAAYDGLMSTATTFPEGVNVVVAAMVQSPYFIYRTELGVPDPKQAGRFVLTPYEIAQELSYTLTQSMPDAELAAVADNQTLNDPKVLAAQAERLLASPRGHTAVGQFFMAWMQVAQLNLQARSEGTVILDDTTKLDMQNETRAFIEDTVFTQNGAYKDLLSRDTTFMNATLATFYTGSPSFTPAPGAASHAGMTGVSATAMGRLPGILGQGGVLTAASQPTYASPTLRGRMLRMRLLCGSVPPPPPGIPPLPAPSGQQTLRQRFEAHASGASCVSCHTLMDPLAFPLGGYDTLGRARAGGTEDGLPLDLTGHIDPTNVELGQTVTVTGPQDLIAGLAQSPEAAACLSRHWSMYALGRLSWEEDACTFDAVAQQAALKNNNLQSTLLALTLVPSFTVRVMDP